MPRSRNVRRPSFVMSSGVNQNARNSIFGQRSHCHSWRSCFVVVVNDGAVLSNADDGRKRQTLDCLLLKPRAVNHIADFCLGQFLVLLNDAQKQLAGEFCIRRTVLDVASSELVELAFGLQSIGLVDCWLEAVLRLRLARSPSWTS